MPNPLDPLSSLARRASPQYTVTYLLTVVFCFAGVCLAAGVLAGGLAQDALVGCGILLGLAAFGLIGVVMFKKPELLRSEPHLRFLAILEWSRDPSLDEDAVRRREQILPELLEGHLRKADTLLRLGKEADSDE